MGVLATFTPAAGDFAGQNYVLPPAKSAHEPQMSFTDTTATSMMPQMQSGSYDPAGANRSFFDYGEIHYIAAIIDRFLIERGYGANWVGMEAAKRDFYKAVVNGGKGILAETMADGSIRRTTAYVQGQPKPIYYVGSPIVEIDVTLRCPTGLWYSKEHGFELIQ